MNEEISNGTAITLAAVAAVCIIGILGLLCGIHDAKEAIKTADKIGEEIKAGKCPVRVATACGDEVCKYTARVPCAELEALVKRGAREP